MNKQEAIKRIEDLYLDNGFTRKVKEIISQIDEPKKVVVPKCLAEWYEENKHNFNLNLIILISDCYFEEPEAIKNIKDVFDLYCEREDFITLVVNMHQFGYEIEQEKLYVVEIPDPNADGYSIVLGRSGGKVQIKQTLSTTWEMNCSNQLTEAEIKQDFEWAWNAKFAKEV